MAIIYYEGSVDPCDDFLLDLPLDLRPRWYDVMGAGHGGHFRVPDVRLPEVNQTACAVHAQWARGSEYFHCYVDDAGHAYNGLDLTKPHQWANGVIHD